MRGGSLVNMFASSKGRLLDQYGQMTKVVNDMAKRSCSTLPAQVKDTAKYIGSPADGS